MARGYARGQLGIELEIAAEFAISKVGRFERDYTTAGTDELSQMKGVGPDVGPDIQNQR